MRYSYKGQIFNTRFYPSITIVREFNGVGKESIDEVDLVLEIRSAQFQTLAKLLTFQVFIISCLDDSRFMLLVWCCLLSIKYWNLLWMTNCSLCLLKMIVPWSLILDQSKKIVEKL